MPGGPFMRGFNNPAFHDEVIERTEQDHRPVRRRQVPERHRLRRATSGRTRTTRSRGAITPDDAFANCVKGLKEIAGHAEKKGVTVCVEHLNTRDDTDPMKGHPGYQGDDLDFVAAIIRKVGSPRVKLLFDIYHVQIMHGDLIRRIEADEGHDRPRPHRRRAGPRRTRRAQEINYPAVIKKLLDVGYTGYVGQEFIPTRDPLAGLKQAVRVCDV